jgi:MYXO-CTERM domain-containing protein
MNRTTISVLAIASAAGIASADIAVNGGFEAGSGADANAWTEFAGGASGTVSERAFGAGLSGDYGLRLVAIGSPAGGAFAGANQNSIADGGLASLQENTSVTLSFSANVDLGPGGVAFYALRILNSSGAIVADTGLQSLGATGGGWQSFTSASLMVPAFGAAPSDAYAAFVEFVVNAGAFDGSQASARIDNVQIDATLVPAPGAMALLGLGGLAASRRRRA